MNPFNSWLPSIPTTLQPMVGQRVGAVLESVKKIRVLAVPKRVLMTKIEKGLRFRGALISRYGGLIFLVCGFGSADQLVKLVGFKLQGRCYVSGFFSVIGELVV